MLYDPHNRSSASLEALELRKRALALETGLRDDDTHLMALAVAQQSATARLYQVICSGYGSVKIYIDDHWLAQVAFEVSELPRVEDRKPAKARR